MTTATTNTVALVRFRWTAGDRWDSDEYAVFVDGQPVDLTAGWTAFAQVISRRDSGLVLATWSSAVTDPELDGRITFGSAIIPLAGEDITTGTVQLHHSPAVSARWGPIVGELGCRITQRASPDGPATDGRTIVAGSVRAEPGVGP